MLDQSILAKDRRREMVILGLMSLIVVVQFLISLSWVDQFIGAHKSMIAKPLFILNQIIAITCFTLVIIWTVLRLLRLRQRRRFAFLFGLFIWLILFVVAIGSEFMAGLGHPWVNLLSPMLLFILLQCAFSVSARLGSSAWLNESGWPICKGAHIVYLLVVSSLIGLDLLSVWQVLAFAAFGIFIVSRYAFNRWIYASYVDHPYKKTAAQFYIKQMSKSS